MLVAQASTWGDTLRDGFQGFFAFIPNLVGFLVILLVGYLVARVLAGALTRLLAGAGLDRRLTSGQGGRWVAQVTERPSQLLGRVAFWALMLGVFALAVPVLGIAAFTAFVAAIWAYVPNIVAALLIFLVASAIAAGVATLAQRTMGDTPTGKIVSTVAPGLVMAIAVFMILNQLQIAPAIVTITYAALIGAFALAAALAFGLGGRDVAARMLETAYVKGQESSEQVKRDLAQGRERARHDMERARDSAEDDAEGDSLSEPPMRRQTARPVGVTNNEGDLGATRIDRPGGTL